MAAIVAIVETCRRLDINLRKYLKEGVPRLATTDTKQLLAHLLEIIARDQVPDRPGRREPRTVKRRPKPYQLLNRSRQLRNELQHRSKYRKNRELI